MESTPTLRDLFEQALSLAPEARARMLAELRVSPERWQRAFRYIASRPELEDIVISGGGMVGMTLAHLLRLRGFSPVVGS